MSDLSEYRYNRLYLRPGLMAVGWLDENHPFAKGDAPQGLLERLWAYCERPIAQTRGFYECPWCSHSELEPLRVHRHGTSADLELGDAEIRVFSNTGMAFAAPSLIYHYVQAHRYLPPQTFLEAVLTGPLPGSAVYEDLIRHYALYDDLWGWR